MAKNKNKKDKKKTSFKLGFTGFIFAVFGIAMLVLFLPTTFLLTVGLLPTFIAAVVDQEPGKNKTFTIGAMNFAGCFPYLLQIWTHKPNSMEAVMMLLSDPLTIVIIYSAAWGGYLLNAVVSIAVSAILIQKSKARLVKIKDEKEVLEKRWGRKVNGKFQLNELGFPIEEELETD